MQMLAIARRFRPPSALSPDRSLPRTRAAALAAIAVLSLLLSACGGVEDPLANAADAATVSGVSGLAASSTTIAAGGAATFTVTLADAARSSSGAVTVYLSYSRSLLAGPRWIRIPNGQRSASFTLRSSPYLAAPTAAAVTANTQSPDPFTITSQQVTLAAAAPLPATPRPDVLSVTFSPPTVTSGQASMATVTLTGPAPAGGAVVLLASSYDQFGQIAEVPATVTVPEGASAVAFPVPTHLASAVATQRALPISGSYFGGPWRGAWLTVVAP
jgi:hypothetical protein